LREKAASRGLGRVELLPLKYSGSACAKCFTKYLTKAVASEKSAGDEKCRLFGAWGGVRFVHPRFSFLSSRIVQKRKAWLAEALELRHPAELPQMLGVHWWFHFGEALRDVIMPQESYMVGARKKMVWDDIGLRALARDWAAWPGPPSEDLMHRSQFNLFRDIGSYLYGRSSDALRFAMDRIALAEPKLPAPVDPQLSLALKKSVGAVKKNINS
jgi:hypothetical protein